MNKKQKRWTIAIISMTILLILYLLKNYSLFIRVAGFTVGLTIFYVLDDIFKIDFKIRHYIYIIIILAFGILFSPLYFISENYDKILHFISPIFASALIFYLVNDKNLTFQWKLLITFMFVVSFLAIHEMGEYLMDLLWDLKLQGVYIRDVSGFEKFHLVLPKKRRHHD